MAANFWQSSHCCKWLLEPSAVQLSIERDTALQSTEDYSLVHMFFADVIQKLSQELGFKQQIAATAQMYFKRFYFKNSLASVDPFLLSVTAVYLAGKVEEFGSTLKGIVTVANRVRRQHFESSWQKLVQPDQLVTCEFWLIQEMGFSLIVFHPYLPLAEYAADSGHSEALLTLAWSILNDTYRSDICLLYPPYLIALAVIQVAAAIKERDISSWFSELTVNTTEVLALTNRILDLYRTMEAYNPTVVTARILPHIYATSAALDREHVPQGTTQL